MSDNLLPTRAWLVWAGTTSAGEDAHEIVVMSNGWLRVTWPSGSMIDVSPAAVKFVHGRGVSYGA